MGLLSISVCLPADLSSNTAVKPEALRQYYKNGLLDPVRLSVG